MAEQVKNDYDYAVQVTIKIAENLETFKSNRKLYLKTLRSIFDDQLKIHTDFNRAQRHKSCKKIEEVLKHYESK